MNQPLERDSEREIVVSRLIDAPRERVFAAWTDPEQIVRWWGPTGFTTTTHEIDVRTGGRWVLTMRGPDGKEYPNKTHFEEVEAPERIVYSTAGGKRRGPGAHFRSRASFVDRGGKTELILRMIFPTAAEREHVIREFGAVEGGRQTLERLAGLVEA